MDFNKEFLKWCKKNNLQSTEMCVSQVKLFLDELQKNHNKKIDKIIVQFNEVNNSVDRILNLSRNENIA